jgi:hypothetical protein
MRRLSWDKKTILAKLRQHRRVGGDLPPLADLIRRDSRLGSAAQRHFGSYRSVLAALGIRYHPSKGRPVYKDAAATIAEMRQRLRSGKALSYRKIRDDDRALLLAAERYFGGWRAALRAAGIEYQPVRPVRVWDRPRVLAELRQLRAQGIDLSAGHMSTTPGKRPLYQAAARYFGSYRKAVQEAGIDYESVRRPRNRVWSRSRVLTLIRQLHARGKRLNVKSMRRSSSMQALMCAGVRHFGGWAAAVQAAGIDYSQVKQPHWAKKWTPEQVIRSLRKRHAAGDDLSSTSIKRNRTALYAAAKRYFGLYRTALEQAGIDYSAVARRRSPWTRAEVIAALRALHGSGDRMASGNAASLPLRRVVPAASRIFGSYLGALKAAGIPRSGRERRAAKPPKRSAGHWNERSILSQLRLLNRQGKDLRDRTMKVRYLSLYWAARDHFGTWVNAVERAGINYERVVQRALRRQQPRR